MDIRHMSLIITFLIGFATCASAGRSSERIGCTALAVDGRASSDGSAFAGMNADGANADYRLAYVPAQKHAAGSNRLVYTYNLSFPRFVGHQRGPYYKPEMPNSPLSDPVGSIPEVEETFGYYEATEPLMNDKGLGLGESSCAAMLVNKFPDDATDQRDVPTGMLDTVTMMQLALERCELARCAVDLLGRMSDEFGFVPTPGESVKGSVYGRPAWDDAGEAYTISDRKGEAWVFHVLGGVTGVVKSIWAGQRVPKGHVAVVANDFIIGELPEVPNEDFAFNPDIFRAAKQAGLWNGEGKLHFSRTFAPDPMTFESPTGRTPIPLYASVRRWGIYDLAAPSQNLKFAVNNQDLPFSVAPDQPLTHRGVMKFLRYQYEGTEFDMTKGILAGPFGNPFRLEGGDPRGQIPRGISIPRTLYSIICQSNPKSQIAWFAMDTPSTSVYVPLLAAANAISELYSKGRQSVFSRNAGWAFNFVSNFMQLNFRDMSAQDVYPAIEDWQERIDAELETASALTPESLNVWQANLQERVVQSWWNMSEFLIMKYNDGFVNYPKVGVASGYPAWYTEMIGFNNDVHPIWVKPALSPPPSISELFAGFIQPKTVLPTVFDFGTKTWQWPRVSLDELDDTAVLPSRGLGLVATGICTLLVFVAGLAIGSAMKGAGKERLGDDFHSF